MELNSSCFHSYGFIKLAIKIGKTRFYEIKNILSFRFLLLRADNVKV